MYSVLNTVNKNFKHFDTLEEAKDHAAVLAQNSQGQRIVVMKAVLEAKLPITNIEFKDL